MSGWVYLAGAIAFEIAGTVNLKLSDGMSRLLPTVLVFPLYAASFALLAVALKTVPVSVAYAIWSAIGVAVIAAIGMIWFREPVSWFKLAALGLIILGVVALHWAERLESA